ncbi:MAG TPA: FG-GAP-like repeat-containing protein [Polyangiaceae bacterium]|nr:FG-GAP-like repeat-containing protein [Polyangiaceae bacterium]
MNRSLHSPSRFLLLGCLIGCNAASSQPDVGAGASGAAGHQGGAQPHSGGATQGQNERGGSHSGSDDRGGTQSGGTHAEGGMTGGEGGAGTDGPSSGGITSTGGSSGESEPVTGGSADGGAQGGGSHLGGSAHGGGDAQGGSHLGGSAGEDAGAGESGGGSDAGSSGSAGAAGMPSGEAPKCEGTLGLPGLPSVPVARSPRYVVSGDWDGDRRADLAVVGAVANSVGVLLSQGAGKFAPITEYSVPLQPTSAVAGDVDGDGALDLVIVTSDPSQSLVFLINLGDGKFELDSTYTAELTVLPRAVTISDLNGDGRADLAVTGSGGLNVLLGQGGGRFRLMASSADPWSAGAIGAADFNDDGRVDLALIPSYGTELKLFVGRGDGTFEAPSSHFTGIPDQDPPALSSTSLSVADLNGDGASDIALASEPASEIAVLLGRKDGTFASATHYEAPSGPHSLVAADLDGDRKPELAVVSPYVNVTAVLRNLGDGTFASRREYAGGAQTWALAVADLDGDGSADLAVVNESTDDLSVLINDQHGSFAAPHSLNPTRSFDPVRYPDSVAAADFNHDGRSDLAVINANTQKMSVFTGDGGGAFAPAENHTTQTTAKRLIAADLNGDGWDDVVLAGDGCEVLLNDGTGRLNHSDSYVAGQRTESVIAADLNGDGAPDLAAVNFGSNDVSVFVNRGDGRFAAAKNFRSGVAPTALTATDLNGDGHTDIIVSNSGAFIPGSGFPANPPRETVSVLFNVGEGGLSSPVTYALPAAPGAITHGDWNGDGKPDVAVASYTGTDIVGQIYILLNTGDGILGAPVSYPVGRVPTGLARLDLNNDSRADLAVANSQGNITVLLNQGAGRFNTSHYAAGRGPTSLAAADFDRDGRLDLAVTNPNDNNNDVRILLNRCLE